MQFKLEFVGDGISLFVRENADVEWVRADKRLIQMIDEGHAREYAHTNPGTNTAADARCIPRLHLRLRRIRCRPSTQTGDGFPLLAIVVVSLASATGIVLLTVMRKMR